MIQMMAHLLQQNPLQQFGISIWLKQGLMDVNRGLSMTATGAVAPPSPLDGVGAEGHQAQAKQVARQQPGSHSCDGG